MLSRIVGTGIRTRILVALVALGLLIWGFVRFSGAQVEALPEFAPVTVEVQAEALGLSAQEVEDLVTTPLESNLLSGVAWVESMRSSSLPGLSSILMTFEPGTDIVRARQVVQERLTQGALLTNASKAPVMLQPTSAVNRAMIMSVTSNRQSLMDLSVLARWTLRPKLMSVPGVANVAIWGMRDRQLQVHADPARMRAAGVSLDQVVASTGNALWVSPLSYLSASTPGRGGFIDLPQQRVNVQHISPIKDAKSLSRIAIEGTTGQTTLGQVANVVESNPTIIGDGIVDGDSGIVLVVEKQPGVSTAEVTAGVESAVEALRLGLPGVTLDASAYRAATYSDEVPGNLLLAFVVGLLVLAATYGLVMRSWRAAVIVLAAASVTAVVSWLVFDLRSLPVTVLAVTGVAAATVIAGLQAILAVGVLQRTGSQSGRRQRMQLAYSETAPAIVVTALAAICLVLPVYLLKGRAGALLPEVADGFILTMVVATIVLLFVVPATAALVLSGPHGGDAPASAALGSRYPNWLRRFIGIRAYAAVAVVLGVILAPVLIGQIGVDTRPAFNERTLVVTAEAPAGTSPAAMVNRLGSLGAEIRALPGVSAVTGHVGRAVQAERIVGTNNGELWVALDPSGSPSAVTTQVERLIGRVSGITAHVGNPLDGRADALIPDASHPLVVSVYGPSPETLAASAKRTLDVVSSVRGVTGAAIVPEQTEPTVQIAVDLAKVEQLGLTPGDVRRQAATLVGGLEVGSIFEGQKVYDVQVWSGPGLRNNPDKLRSLPIDTPSGQVPLGQLATIAIADEPRVIRREAVQRRLDITARVTRDAGDVRQEVSTALAQMQLPAEYHAEVRQEASVIDDNHRAMIWYSVAAGLIILLLVQAITRNWWISLLAILSVPLAAVGGLVASAFLGDLGYGALAGLGVLATVCLSMTMQVSSLLRADDGEASVDSVVLRAGSVAHAVVPVVIALATASLALLLIGDRPGLEGIRDLSVVTLGGAITLGAVALFVIPAVFAVVGRREEDAHDLEFGDETASGSHAHA